MLRTTLALLAFAATTLVATSAFAQVPSGIPAGYEEQCHKKTIGSGYRCHVVPEGSVPVWEPFSAGVIALQAVGGIAGGLILAAVSGFGTYFLMDNAIDHDDPVCAECSFVASLVGTVGVFIGMPLGVWLTGEATGGDGKFASGLMILVYRPFDVGDLIEVSGVSGTVDRMTLVSTSILTLDNQLLIVPNNKIWNDVIRNVTAQDRRRVDFTFGIGYEDDIDRAAEILRDIVSKTEHVDTEAEIIVEVHELGDSSVNFAVRVWTETEHYWAVFWAINAEVKRRFDAEGISIPFPQTDVHVHQAA